MSLAFTLKTFLDEHQVNYHTLKHHRCFFEAGNHDEAIKLRFADFKKLVRPKVVDFIVH